MNVKLIRKLLMALGESTGLTADQKHYLFVMDDGDPIPSDIVDRLKVFARSIGWSTAPPATVYRSGTQTTRELSSFDQELPDDFGPPPVKALSDGTLMRTYTVASQEDIDRQLPGSKLRWGTGYVKED